MKKLVVVIATLLLVACQQQEVYCADPVTRTSMPLSEALTTAQRSECARYEPQTQDAFCNNETGTWWLPINTARPNCNPACVVWISNQSAEVNWRCTGLLPE